MKISFRVFLCVFFLASLLQGCAARQKTVIIPITEDGSRAPMNILRVDMPTLGSYITVTPKAFSSSYEEKAGGVVERVFYPLMPEGASVKLDDNIQKISLRIVLVNEHYMPQTVVMRYRQAGSNAPLQDKIIYPEGTMPRVEHEEFLPLDHPIEVTIMVLDGNGDIANFIGPLMYMQKNQKRRLP